MTAQSVVVVIMCGLKRYTFEIEQGDAVGIIGSQWCRKEYITCLLQGNQTYNGNFKVNVV
jgi:ABC-type polysaccharide/polyol phosphate transport system ATPase subunit